MTDSRSGSESLDELAHDFVERYRRGERPALTEYSTKHPELADEIRELFPALVMMEDFWSAGDSAMRLAGAAPPPKQLGEYRILREVARGGMGIVYEAV